MGWGRGVAVSGMGLAQTILCVSILGRKRVFACIPYGHALDVTHPTLATAQDFPDYYDVIKHPMTFNKVKAKLKTYPSWVRVVQRIRR